MKNIGRDGFMSDISQRRACEISSVLQYLPQIAQDAEYNNKLVIGVFDKIFSANYFRELDGKKALFDPKTIKDILKAEDFNAIAKSVIQDQEISTYEKLQFLEEGISIYGYNELLFLAVPFLYRLNEEIHGDLLYLFDSAVNDRLFSKLTYVYNLLPPCCDANNYDAIILIRFFDNIQSLNIVAAANNGTGKRIASQLCSENVFEPFLVDTIRDSKVSLNQKLILLQSAASLYSEAIWPVIIFEIQNLRDLMEKDEFLSIWFNFILHQSIVFKRFEFLLNYVTKLPYFVTDDNDEWRNKVLYNTLEMLNSLPSNDAYEFLMSSASRCGFIPIAYNLVLSSTVPILFFYKEGKKKYLITIPHEDKSERERFNPLIDTLNRFYSNNKGVI